MSRELNKGLRTEKQQVIVSELVHRFGIDGSKILFLNENDPLDPWLNYKALLAVARGSKKFRAISEAYCDYIAPLQQILHTATVIDADGLEYTRTGAAKIGEKLPNEDIADEHELAGARALRTALDSAGFDLRALPETDAAPDGDTAEKQNPVDRAAEHFVKDQVAHRGHDLKSIHVIAERKGLIIRTDRPDGTVKVDRERYKEFLMDNFEADTACEFGQERRASLINLLQQLPDAKRSATA